MTRPKLDIHYPASERRRSTVSGHLSVISGKQTIINNKSLL